MNKVDLIKIFEEKRDCQALISNRYQGWTSVQQVDAMTKESFVKATNEIINNIKKNSFKNEDGDIKWKIITT